MRKMSTFYSFLAIILAVSVTCSADVLLNDTFADASRTETSLPVESAVWAGTPASITMGTGSLAYAQSGSSQKLWTYFTADGAPVALNVGDKLVATIEFSPEGAFHDSTSRNFRFGLFNDPTDPQLWSDTNSDNGGDGRWTDSTGYAVQFSIGAATASTIQVGKRTDQTNTSLLGSTGAYTWSSSQGGASGCVLDTVYTMTLTLDYQAADLMQIDFEFAGGSVNTSASLTDNGLGGDPIWANFDQLFFRFSSTAGTADVIDIHRIKIEHIQPTAECTGVGTPYSAYAAVSCRTGGGAGANTNMSDSSKLSVRASAEGAKSWIKFDINGLDIDPNFIKTATLRVTLHVGKGGAQTCDVSAVNDNYRTNIGWAETDITWTNAPGNDTSSLGALNTSQTTLMGTISFSDGIAGQQFYVDVLPAIQADADGILQFVLHNSANLLDFATHDHAASAPLSAEDFWPRLDILQGPAGADAPMSPCPGSVVGTDLNELSWTNPEPNEPADFTCTVYLGTEPNRPQMHSVELALNANSVLINTDNFGTFGNLQNLQEYYWIVDCYNETTSTLIPGLVWSFYVNNNEAPLVSAGADQVVWGLPITVNLDGAVADDGLPNPPGAYTVEWTQVANDAPSVTPSPDNTVDTSVVITEAGDYEFKLTASDTQASASDTVRIVVGEDGCDASHLSTGAAYAAGDINEDCMVNLDDFAELIASHWMECTDTVTNCPQD